MVLLLASALPSCLHSSFVGLAPIPSPLTGARFAHCLCSVQSVHSTARAPSMPCQAPLPKQYLSHSVHECRPSLLRLLTWAHFVRFTPVCWHISDACASPCLCSRRAHLARFPQDVLPLSHPSLHKACASALRHRLPCCPPPPHSHPSQAASHCVHALATLPLCAC